MLFGPITSCDPCNCMLADESVPSILISVPVPNTVLPSMKFTVPVGAPSEPVTLTVAVSVVACVSYRLLCPDVSTVVLPCCWGLIVMLNTAVAVFDAESVTFTVKLDVPAAVGVPEMTLLVRPSPGGNEPEMMLHVYGGVPPVAAREYEYAIPTAPLGGAVVVMVTVPDAIVILRFAVAVWEDESVTLSVKLEVPVAVGVPVIAEPTRLNPGGNDPALIVQV
jgi:hypothetical protein